MPIAPHFRFAVLLALGALQACRPSTGNPTGAGATSVAGPLPPCTCPQDEILCNQDNVCICSQPVADAGAPRTKHQKCQREDGPGPVGACRGTCEPGSCYCNPSGQCLCLP
jgi:hypothetical protein